MCDTAVNEAKKSLDQTEKEQARVEAIGHITKLFRRRGNRPFNGALRGRPARKLEKLMYFKLAEGNCAVAQGWVEALEEFDLYLPAPSTAFATLADLGEFGVNPAARVISQRVHVFTAEHLRIESLPAAIHDLAYRAQTYEEAGPRWFYGLTTTLLPILRKYISAKGESDELMEALAQLGSVQLAIQGFDEKIFNFDFVQSIFDSVPRWHSCPVAWDDRLKYAQRAKDSGFKIPASFAAGILIHGRQKELLNVLWVMDSAIDNGEWLSYNDCDPTSKAYVLGAIVSELTGTDSISYSVAHEFDLDAFASEQNKIAQLASNEVERATAKYWVETARRAELAVRLISTYAD